MAAYTASAHADRVQSALHSSEAARSALVASWQRSATLHRLDPADRKPPRRMTASELRQARNRVEPLIRVSKASLDRLYLAVGGVGCCVLLADSNGVPVERRGAPGDDRTFEEWGLWPGTVWSEQSEGTNGIGTCLVEQRTLTIHRDQHFFSKNTLLSCTTAPIYDHQGNLVAALDVSSCRADLTEGFVSLIAMAVGDAVRRIEAEAFRLAFPNARVLLAPTPDNSPAALIAVDGDDLVVGATRAARVALGLLGETFASPVPVSDLLDISGPRSEDLVLVERAAVRRALARVDGNVSAAARDLGISRATLHRKLARLGLNRCSHPGA
jgi:transcriptional regulator of acetoin/glycerol metabolism